MWVGFVDGVNGASAVGMLPHPRRAWALLAVGDPVVLDAPIEVPYPLGYVVALRGEATVTGNLLWRVREDAGMTQDELAKASGTSRTALSAYEHGRKSPRLDTAERIVAAAGRRLTVTDDPAFVVRDLGRGRTTLVPVTLPRLAPEGAFAAVELPVHLNWSQPGRVFRLADRSDRARVYELVLAEGAPEDVTTYIDGTLLVDLWNDLVLPRVVRDAWAPLIDAVVPVVA